MFYNGSSKDRGWISALFCKWSWKWKMKNEANKISNWTQRRVHVLSLKAQCFHAFLSWFEVCWVSQCIVVSLSLLISFLLVLANKWVHHFFTIKRVWIEWTLVFNSIGKPSVIYHDQQQLLFLHIIQISKIM